MRNVRVYDLTKGKCDYVAVFDMGTKYCGLFKKKNLPDKYKDISSSGVLLKDTEKVFLGGMSNSFILDHLNIKLNVVTYDMGYSTKNCSLYMNNDLVIITEKLDTKKVSIKSLGKCICDRKESRGN